MSKNQSSDSYEFTHPNSEHYSTMLSGNVTIVAEIICVHSFDHEVLNVFHPIYGEAPSSTITRAIVTCTEVQAPTKQENMKAENFKELVQKWLASLDESICQPVAKIVTEHYTFLEYLP